MTTAEVKTMIASIGVPFAYYQFPESAKACPFICFFYSGSNDFLADSSNYVKIENLVIELYTKNKDFTLEATVEGVLAQNGLVWSRSEYYIDNEKLYQTIYETDILLQVGNTTEEVNNS